jgi:hypothetical protein
MSPFKFLVFVALVGFGYYQWREKHDAPARPAEAPAAGALSFVAAPAFGEAGNVVVIATTDDCPERAKARAQQLAQELKDQGIPTVWAPPASAATAGTDPAAARRLAAIKAGEQPLVLIRGKAKSNPLLAEIILEYQRL